MVLCYRSLFVLPPRSRDTRTAQAARLGYGSPRLALRSLGQLVANLTLQVWQRAQTLHGAALARNNDGPLRFLPAVSPTVAAMSPPPPPPGSPSSPWPGEWHDPSRGFPEPLLELAGVSYAYADGSVGLAGCSLAIGRGSRNALIGANGSGKTTLFQHANGLLRPQAGQVSYGGRPSITGVPACAACAAASAWSSRTRTISFFRQRAGGCLLRPLNLGLSDAVVRRQVDAALEAVGMAAAADKAVHHLSFGQKKRVCIAGVLAMEPELLVLDEPMAGLDHGMQDELLAILDGLHGRGITLLLATHDIDFAYGWADAIHLMAAGRCVAPSPPPTFRPRRAAGRRRPAAARRRRHPPGSGGQGPGAAPAARSASELLAGLEIHLSPKGNAMSRRLNRLPPGV